jgi:uncharacterized RDD family membrane protein YckC
MAPPPVSPGGQPLADFGDRLLAYLIDTAILLAVTMIVALPAFLIFFLTVVQRAVNEAGPDGTTSDANVAGIVLGGLALGLGLFVFTLAITYVYAVELMYKSGQTVGKRVMRLRVIPFDPAARLTRGIAAKRWLVEYGAGALLPLFNYLDGLWQLWDKPFLQTLHDKFAQTVVVRVSP